MTALILKAKAVLEGADRISGGWLGILYQSFVRFIELRGSEAAASLAYYMLFALFPLTLLLVGLMGYVIERQVAYTQVLLIVRSVFPFSDSLLDKNLQGVLERRNAFSAVGLIGLLWSASGFFNTLAININRAWPKVKLRGLVHGRLFAFAMIGALLVLLLLSLISTTLINLLPVLLRYFGGNPAILESSGWQTILRLVPAIFTFLLFISLYRLVPNKVVNWRAVLIGSAVVALLWELAKSVFAYFLGSGLARFELVYGPLSALIALMVWSYVSNGIALFGAHLVSTIDQRVEQLQNEPVFEPEIDASMVKGVRG